MSCWDILKVKVWFAVCVTSAENSFLLSFFFFFLQRIGYCITPEHEHHLVAEGNVRQFKVSFRSIWMTHLSFVSWLVHDLLLIQKMWHCFAFQLKHWLAIWWQTRRTPSSNPSGVLVRHQWSDGHGQQKAPTRSAPPPFFFSLCIY